MPARSKRMRPKTAKERMSARRKRLRAQGLRPVQHWVPDLRDPRVCADLLRQGRLLTQHPENAAARAQHVRVFLAFTRV